MYYVIGYNGYTKIFMTQKLFNTRREAQEYADGCNRDWKPTVVRVCEN